MRDSDSLFDIVRSLSAPAILGWPPIESLISVIVGSCSFLVPGDKFHIGAVFLSSLPSGIKQAHDRKQTCRQHSEYWSSSNRTYWYVSVTGPSIRRICPCFSCLANFWSEPTYVPPTHHPRDAPAEIQSAANEGIQPHSGRPVEVVEEIVQPHSGRQIDFATD